MPDGRADEFTCGGAASRRPPFAVCGGLANRESDSERAERCQGVGGLRAREWSDADFHRAAPRRIEKEETLAPGIGFHRTSALSSARHGSDGGCGTQP